MNEQDQAFIYERLQECRENRRSYKIWLEHLKPWNALTMVSPAVLSVIAGSTILAEPTFLGPDKGRVIAGVFALVSAVLTTIHKVLNCDPHQAECHRIMRAYSSLEAGYKGLKIHDNKLKEELLKLNTRFEQIKDGAAAEPPEWCLTRARKEPSTTPRST